MGLTAKVLTMDAIATVLTGVIVGVYAGFLSGTSLWLISSARGTTATALVLGIGAWVLHLLARTQSASAEDLGWVAIMLSQVALIAAVIGLITGSTVALAVLVVGAAALWLIATARHAIGITGQMYSGHRPPQKMPRVPVPGGAVAPKTGVKGTGAFPFHGDAARVRAGPVGRLPGHRGGRRRRDGLPALLGAAALAEDELIEHWTLVGDSFLTDTPVRGAGPGLGFGRGGVGGGYPRRVACMASHRRTP